MAKKKTRSVVGGWVDIPTRVVPASAEALEQFLATDLIKYAEEISGQRAKTKARAIHLLIASGRATLCASLGD